MNLKNIISDAYLVVKPQIHQAFDKSIYKPGKYLKPLEEHLRIEDSIESREINNAKVN